MYWSWGPRTGAAWIRCNGTPPSDLDFFINAGKRHGYGIVSDTTGYMANISEGRPARASQEWRFEY